MRVTRLVEVLIFVSVSLFSFAAFAQEADAGPPVATGLVDASVATPQAAADAAPNVLPPIAAVADGGATDAGASDDDELSMKITGTTRAADMSAFAEESAKETKIGSTKARYSLNFFGDVNGGFEASTRRDFHPTFGIGGLSFLFTGNLENSIKATSEILFELPDNKPGVDVERLHLRWTKGGFWVEAGRTHADLGYWNVAFHHGKWLQPTIERPRGVRFEDDGGVLPIHWVGLGAGYNLALGGGRTLATAIAVGNGRGAIVDDVQSEKDTNPAKQVMAKIEMQGLGLRELRFGVSGVYGHISQVTAAERPALPGIGLDEIIGNVFVAYPSLPVIAIAEAYLVSHKGPTRSWETYDAFAVIGYQIPPITPYIKAERLVMTAGLDPFFVPDPLGVNNGNVPPPLPELDVVDGIVGARWDMSNWCALKGEYRFDKLIDSGELVHSTFFSWQFAL